MTEQPLLIPPARSSSTSVSSPWWPFLFGIVVGYVIFRPGGVKDYLFPDQMAEAFLPEHREINVMSSGSIMPNGMAARENGGIDSFGFEAPPNGVQGANGGANDSMPVLPRRRNRSVSLPPTDLFGGAGGGMGGFRQDAAPRAPQMGVGGHWSDRRTGDELFFGKQPDRNGDSR